MVHRLKHSGSKLQSNSNPAGLWCKFRYVYAFVGRCWVARAKNRFAAAISRRFTQEKIHRAALAIHRTVQVDPLATHLEVRFVHAPGISHRQGVPLPAFLKIWDVLLHPTKNGGVGQGFAPEPICLFQGSAVVNALPALAAAALVLKRCYALDSCYLSARSNQREDARE
jgi:hypothetical protein